MVDLVDEYIVQELKEFVVKKLNSTTKEELDIDDVDATCEKFCACVSLCMWHVKTRLPILTCEKCSSMCVSLYMCLVRCQFSCQWCTTVLGCVSLVCSCEYTCLFCFLRGAVTSTPFLCSLRVQRRFFFYS